MPLLRPATTEQLKSDLCSAPEPDPCRDSGRDFQYRRHGFERNLRCRGIARSDRHNPFGSEHQCRLLHFRRRHGDEHAGGDWTRFNLRNGMGSDQHRLMRFARKLPVRRCWRHEYTGGCCLISCRFTCAYQPDRQRYFRRRWVPRQRKLDGSMRRQHKHHLRSERRRYERPSLG